MKTSKHKTATKSKPASIRKHAQTLGKLGGRPKKETSDRLTTEAGRPSFISGKLS